MGRPATRVTSSKGNLRSTKWYCGGCDKKKFGTEFYTRASKNGRKIVVSQWCKPCYIKYSTIRWSTKVNRRAYWLNKYKECKGCAHCGYNQNAVALDWHHPHRKGHAREGIASMKSHSLKNLFAALRKCILLCSNCHRVEHQRTGWKERHANI